MPIEIVTARLVLPSIVRSARASTSLRSFSVSAAALLDVGLGQDQHELLAAVAADAGRSRAGSRASVWATPRRTMSPASWPYVSLTALKWSMSTKATDSGRS